MAASKSLKSLEPKLEPYEIRTVLRIRILPPQYSHKLLKSLVIGPERASRRFPRAGAPTCDAGAIDRFSRTRFDDPVSVRELSMDRRTFLRNVIGIAGAAAALAGVAATTAEAAPISRPTSLPELPKAPASDAGRTPDGTEVEQAQYWRRRRRWVVVRRRPRRMYYGRRRRRYWW